MNIFGFTITRTSKKKEEEKELEIFEMCVDAMDKVITRGKSILSRPPTIDVVQNLAEIQEHLEGLIEIYNTNKYSRPADMFRITEIIHDMRQIYLNYAKSSQQLSMIMSDIERLKNVNDSEYNLYGGLFKKQMETATNKTYKSIVNNINTASKEYYISLQAIRFTITYDITRLGTGVDIIKQYHDTKGYTVPAKGVEYTVRFKKLSRDEILDQVKKQKEEKENESK